MKARYFVAGQYTRFNSGSGAHNAAEARADRTPMRVNDYDEKTLTDSERLYRAYCTGNLPQA